MNCLGYVQGIVHTGLRNKSVFNPQISSRHNIKQIVADVIQNLSVKKIKDEVQYLIRAFCNLKRKRILLFSLQIREEGGLIKQDSI